MKKFIAIVFAFGIGSTLSAMENNEIEANVTRRRKYVLFQKLIQDSYLERTKALSDLQQRCAPGVPWRKVELRIIELLRQYDLYRLFIKHPALADLRAESCRYKIKRFEPLTLEQDLAGLDVETRIGGVGLLIIDKAYEKINGAKEDIERIIFKLTFVPDELENLDLSE